jgi:hypothetical protein
MLLLYLCSVSEENSQIFVPFVVDVRFGADTMLLCHDVGGQLDSPSTSSGGALSKSYERIINNTVCNTGTPTLTPQTTQQSPCVSPRPHTIGGTHPLYTQLSAGSIVVDSDALPPSPPLSSPQICATPTKEDKETQELHIEYWTHALSAAVQDKNGLSWDGMRCLYLLCCFSIDKYFGYTTTC